MSKQMFQSIPVQIPHPFLEDSKTYQAINKNKDMMTQLAMMPSKGHRRASTNGDANKQAIYQPKQFNLQLILDSTRDTAGGLLLIEKNRKKDVKDLNITSNKAVVGIHSGMISERNSKGHLGSEDLRISNVNPTKPQQASTERSSIQSSLKE